MFRSLAVVPVLLLLGEVYLDGASTGKMETNLGGKLSFSVELGNGSAVDVKIVKC